MNHSCTAVRQGWQLISPLSGAMPAHLAALPAKCEGQLATVLPCKQAAPTRDQLVSQLPPVGKQHYCCLLCTRSAILQALAKSAPPVHRPLPR